MANVNTSPTWNAFMSNVDDPLCMGPLLNRWTEVGIHTAPKPPQTLNYQAILEASRRIYEQRKKAEWIDRIVILRGDFIKLEHHVSPVDLSATMRELNSFSGISIDVCETPDECNTKANQHRTAGKAVVLIVNDTMQRLPPIEKGETHDAP